MLTFLGFARVITFMFLILVPILFAILYFALKISLGTAVLQVDPSDIFVPMIPAMLVGCLVLRPV